MKKLFFFLFCFIGTARTTLAQKSSKIAVEHADHFDIDQTEILDFEK